MTINVLTRKISVLLMALTFAAAAHATEISLLPLNTYSAPSSTDVKPNIMFVLDNSGSMAWEHMPDDNDDAGSSVPFNYGYYGYRSSQCNGVYYNPATVYKLPVKSDGTYYPNASFVDASVNGYDINASKVNLSTSFRAETDSSAQAQAAYYFTYSGGQTTEKLKNYYVSTSTFSQECSSASGASPGSNVFTKVVVGASEQQNFANWYSYYRTRMLMMKSASGLAFKDIDGSRFRVGFMAINNVSNSTADFLNIGEFTGTTKDTWYASLYASEPNGGTPLRTALSDAGRLYAGTLTSKNGVTVTDPLQYSCQQNYTILSTDGFWNTGNGYKMDGSTAVGNQDGALARPYNDGASGQVQSRTKALQSQSITPQPLTSTSALQMQTITTQPKTSTSTLQSQTITTQPLTSTSTLQARTTTSVSAPSIQRRTSTNSGTSWSPWTNVASCTVDNSNPSRTECNFPVSTSSDSGATWTAWAYQNSACAADTTSPSRRQCSGSVPIKSAWSNVASCTVSAGTECQYTAWTTATATASCTPLAQSASSPYTVGTARQCSATTTLGAWVNAPSCTTSSTANCRYTAWTTATNTASCTPLAQSASSPYTVGTASQCSATTTLGTWANASSCTTSSTANCRYQAWTTPAATASCTPLAQSASSPYVGPATQCTTVNTLGAWVPASSCTVSSTQNCRYDAWGQWGNALECTPVPESPGPTYTVATAVGCQTLVTSGGIADTLADVAAYYYNTDLRVTGSDTCTALNGNNVCPDNVPVNGRDTAITQHMTTFTVGLGVRGRMVYSPTYLTDKSGDFFDVSTGATTNTGTGVCSWQASGQCNWPAPGMAPPPGGNTNSEGKIENVDDLWHAAVNGHGTYFSATTPDLLSNGLINALKIISNTPRPGTAAAAASSNPNVSASDNFVFSSSYKSVEWYGELIRQELNVTDGTLTAQNWSAMRLLDCATTDWAASTIYSVGSVYRQGGQCYRVITAYTSGATFNASGSPNSGNDVAKTALVNIDEAATTKVPVVAPTSRNIYTARNAALIPFLWANLSTAQQDYFSAPAITYESATPGLSQYCSPDGGISSAGVTCLTAAQKTAASGAGLVNFLRGDRSNEGTIFRQRTHVLGDIVSSEARYVQKPLFNYSDANYAGYKTLKNTRAGRVFVGANDGMLHAFDAATGQEAWAYIPSIVLPNLYKLADKKYTDQNQHQYFVDSSPETGDICPNANAGTPTTCTAAQWKTILVGGLNLGGKGYYALDITDPATPVLLWEFTDPDQNLGYTYGNPTITKLANGKWVVLVSSGYNNTDGSVATKGQGRLYVLDATNGTILNQISTGVGDATISSGLARISAHVLDSLTNNTARSAYGGDTLGNLWRFDINNNIGAAGTDAQLLVNLTDANGKAQPVTVKPVKTTINGKPVVYVGTGRYLGNSDVSDTSTQSIYAVKDPLTPSTTPSTPIHGNPRTASSNFVSQTFVNATCPKDTPASVCISKQVVRTTTNNAVDWGTKNGWYIDFITGGERPSGDPSLALGALLFTTITPQASNGNVCGAETGTSASFFCSLDYRTGSAINGTNGVGCASLGSGLVTRPVVISLPDGSVQVLIRGIGGSSDSSGGGSDGSTIPGTGSGTDNADSIIKDVTLPPPPAGNTRRVSWRTLSSQ